MQKYWSRMLNYWSPDVEVLVPRCGSTGPWMCQIVSGNAAGKVRDIFEKNESLRLIVRQNCSLSEIMIFWWNPPLMIFILLFIFCFQFVLFSCEVLMLLYFLLHSAYNAFISYFLFKKSKIYIIYLIQNIYIIYLIQIIYIIYLIQNTRLPGAVPQPLF
jgi:hypothetical protein